jgi:hypothetical protein
MLIYLQEEGIKYNPDIVILGFVYSDMYRNTLEFRDYSKPKFELVNGRLELKNTPVPPPELMRKQLEQDSHSVKFFDILTILYHHYMWNFGPNTERMKKITAAILDEIIETINGIGATPVFVYLPVGKDMRNLDEKMTLREEYFFRYCRERGIQCMSLRPYFVANKKKGGEFEMAHGHLNPRGNLIVAQGIKEYLLDNSVKSISDNLTK